MPAFAHSDVLLRCVLLQIWDVTKLKRTRTMGGHRQRVGTQAWSSHMLSSGSRDKSILLRDVRVPEPYVEKLLGHKSEVCGLKVRCAQGWQFLNWTACMCVTSYSYR
jgi:WD40 repeat protein